MEISDLTKRFSDSYENQCKAIFASVFIVGNRLQTIFDNNIPEISLKQFMLLIMIRQSEEPLTFTRLGKLLAVHGRTSRSLPHLWSKKDSSSLKRVRKMCVRSISVLQKKWKIILKRYFLYIKKTCNIFLKDIRRRK